MASLASQSRPAGTLNDLGPPKLSSLNQALGQADTGLAGLLPDYQGRLGGQGLVGETGTCAGDGRMVNAGRQGPNDGGSLRPWPLVETGHGPVFENDLTQDMSAVFGLECLEFGDHLFIKGFVLHAEANQPIVGPDGQGVFGQSAGGLLEAATVFGLKGLFGSRNGGLFAWAGLGLCLSLKTATSQHNHTWQQKAHGEAPGG